MNASTPDSATKTIWRDGDRIRSTDGYHYSDVLPDAHVERNLADGRDGAEQDAFGRAVLAIRAYERIANGSEST